MPQIPSRFIADGTIKDADIASDAAIAQSKIANFPVKASGAEVNTGTDDAKFVTAKAVADSKLSYTDGVETLTNKRITRRVYQLASDAAPTYNTDSYDMLDITALAADINLSTNISGTPTNGQGLMIRIKDNGSPRAITHGASFEARGVALPTTTVASKVLTIGYIYDTTTSKWGCVASAQEA